MCVITFLEVEPWEKDYLEHKLPKHTLHFFTEPIEELRDEHLADVEVLSPFIYSHVTKKMMARMPKLQMITTRSTGFDHVDAVAAKERTIKVSNVPHYGENTVAEHTMALMLALSRRIVESVGRTRRGNFDTEGLRGFDLKGKTLGVIGTGHIGLHVIRMAKGFEMNVSAYDAYPNESAADDYGFTYVDLETLLRESDVVTLHAPLNDQTKHLINRDNITRMKKGSIIINTARGGLIETDALVWALKEKLILGAGLDVLEEEVAIREERELLSDIFKKKANLETLIEQHILLSQDNVIITPHNAFNSHEALTRILDTTVENIEAYLEGKQINSVVN